MRTPPKVAAGATAEVQRGGNHRCDPQDGGISQASPELSACHQGPTSRPLPFSAAAELPAAASDRAKLARRTVRIPPGRPPMRRIFSPKRGIVLLLLGLSTRSPT